MTPASRRIGMARSGKHRNSSHLGLIMISIVFAQAVSSAQMTAISEDQLAIPKDTSKTAQQWLAGLGSDRDALAAHTNSAQAYAIVGRDLNALGETDAASQALDRALHLNPNLAGALVEKGSILSGQSEWSKATALFRRAVTASPDDAPAHLWLGDMLLRTGVFDGAAGEFEIALRLDPRNSGACQGLGLVHLQEGNFDGAIDDFHRALAIRPDYIDAEKGLAHALASAHRWPEAEQWLNRVLKADPNSPSETDALGTALARMGDKAGADKEFAHARDLSNQELILLRAKGANNWGVTLRKDGQPQDAAAAFRRALDDDPLFCEAHDNLGGVLWLENDAASAMSEFQAAIRCDPNLASAHNNLGMTLLYYDHNLDGAIAQFRVAVDLRPGFALAHLNLGKALAAKQDFTAGESEFRSAIIINPDLAAAHVGLGLLLAMKKNALSTEARVELIKGLQLDPTLKKIVPQSYLAQLQQ